jgi:hypothetical protein
MIQREQERIKSGRKFIIEFVDPSTACISNESIIETDDIAGLCKIVDPEASDIHPAAGYDLELCDIEKIAARFGIVCEGAGFAARLRSWRDVDDLPYKIHTNRELALMLVGDKPFAAFSEQYPSNPEYEFIPERLFDPYVKTALFVKREYVLSQKNNRKTRMVLYAKKTEEWRIDAYILLKKTAEKTGWSEGFERMEGLLLGYEEWQNDIYIEKIFRLSP